MEDFMNQGRIVPKGGAFRVQQPILERNMGVETTEDVSLPDYQPEIKRLLRVSATVQPPTSYVGGGTAEFSGTVDYCILYAGNDGKMYCYPTSSEYAFRVPLEMGAEFDLNEGVVCVADCHAESVISRVGGPRRMNIKCRLRANVRALGTSVVQEKIKGSLPQDCGEERLLREVETSVCGYGVSEPLVISDNIPLESGEWRIISGDANVMVGEVGCGNGWVRARGDIVVKLLLQKEEDDASPVTLWHKMPWEGRIETDSAGIGGDAMVTGTCSELSLRMEEGQVGCEAEILLGARTARPRTLSYTEDWYATGCESSCVSQEMTVPAAPRSLHANFTQSEQRMLDQVGLAGQGKSTVLDIAGVADLETVQNERGRYVISGKCRYSLILELEDGEMTTKELELPFRYTAEGAVEDAIARYEGQVIPMTVRARLDEQKLGIDAELAIALRCFGEEVISPVRQLNIGDKLERETGQMVLCYPARTDTLWSVGKRYHAAIDSLAASNGLNDEHRADAETSLRQIQVLQV